jgi:hypothetical protein
MQLQPDLIITQGKYSQIAFLEYKSPIEKEITEKLIENYVGANGSIIVQDLIRNVIDKHLGYISLDGKTSVWLRTPHPSNYRGPWNTFVEFFLPILSIIVNDLMKNRICAT